MHGREAAEQDGTMSGVRESSQPLAMWARRATITLLLALVVATLFGLLGIRTEQASAESGGYSLSVTYPQVARAGLDARFEIEVRRPGGLPKELVLAVDADYFDLYETQAFHPEPSDSSRDGDLMYLTFTTTPTAETFVVAYDAYLQPSVQAGDAARVAVWDGGRAVVEVDIETRIVP